MNDATLDTLPATEVDDRWMAGIPPSAMPVQFVAHVRASLPDRRWRVQADRHVAIARQAVSCLLEPREGDLVACWLHEAPGGVACHVLAVLERPEPAPATLSVEGDLLLKATGRLQVEAGEELQVDAPQARLVHRGIQVVADVCQATVQQMRSIGDTLTSVFKREIRHSEQHLRTVEGLDLLQAQLIDHRASDLMQLRGENIMTNGTTLVKVQGAQIHFG